MKFSKHKKILIFGISGGGKTTMARLISEKYGHTPIHMDEHFWLENWQQRSQDDFYKRMDDLAQSERWVMEGSLMKLLERYGHQANIIIWLNIPRHVAVARILKRTLMNLGRKVRPEMADGCIEKFDLNFMKWVWKYPEKNDQIRQFLKYNNLTFVELQRNMKIECS